MFFRQEDPLVTVGGGESGIEAVMSDFFALAALVFLFVPDRFVPPPDAFMRQHPTEQ